MVLYEWDQVICCLVDILENEGKILPRNWDLMIPRPSAWNPIIIKTNILQTQIKLINSSITICGSIIHSLIDWYNVVSQRNWTQHDLYWRKSNSPHIILFYIFDLGIYHFIRYDGSPVHLWRLKLCPPTYFLIFIEFFVIDDEGVVRVELIFLKGSFF